MKLVLILLAVVFITFAIWACRAEAQLADHPKQIKAVRTDVPPKLDGRLDDPCWKKAPRATNFIQTEPEEGQPEVNPTVAYVLYDDANLYVAFNCLSSNPSRIVGRIVEHDGYIWNDDLVGVTLDTFHDRQSGFYFFICIILTGYLHRDCFDQLEGWGNMDCCRSEYFLSKLLFFRS